MVEKFVKTIIESYSSQKLDLSLLKKKGNSKTYSGWLIQKMKEARGENNFDVCELLQTCYKEYMGFKTQEEIRIKQWKGKGDIKYFNQPDIILVTYFQRRDEGEEPQEIKDEVPKFEINEVIKAINKLNIGKPIPTSAIAEEVHNVSWHTLFSTRDKHIHLTHILGILNHYGITHYSKRGFSSVIKPVREIQEVLVINK